MKLFGRKKEKNEIAGREIADPEQGMARLYIEMVGKVEFEYAKFVHEHLKRIHEPGGFEREKREADFMDLGMGTGYLEALDDITFSPLQSIVEPKLRGRKKGQAVVVTRWTVQGVHARPLAGVPPSGNQVTIQGETHTVFRDYKIRADNTYWEFPELTRSVVDK